MLDDKIQYDKTLLDGVLTAIKDAAIDARLLHTQESLMTLKDRLERIRYDLDQIQAAICTFAPRAVMAEARNESKIQSYIRQLVDDSDRVLTVHERYAIREIIFCEKGKNCQDKYILNTLIQLRNDT